MQTTSREDGTKPGGSRLFYRGQNRLDRIVTIIGIIAALIFTGMYAYTFWYVFHHDPYADTDDGD